MLILLIYSKCEEARGGKVGLQYVEDMMYFPPPGPPTPASTFQSKADKYVTR